MQIKDRKNSIAGTLCGPVMRPQKWPALMLAIAVACGATTGMTAEAQAQEDGAAGTQEDKVATLGTITVVARKRTEDAQDVPDAISVLSQSVVEAGDLDEVSQFVELVPNATFTQDSETSSEISIRGSARNLADEDPSVGVYRDGVYIGGLLFSADTFYDTERVEILRGPQAGLYGRNAVGGAVNIITARPTFDVNGYVEAQVGNKGNREVRGAFNAPIVDDVLAVRFSGLFLDQDEGFDYIVNQDTYTDAKEVGSIRGRLLFTPSPDWEFLTTVEYITSDGGQALLVPAPDSATGILESEGLVSIPGTSPDDTDNQFRDWPTYKNFEQFHIFQEANWTTDAGTLSGILSYRDASLELSRDDDYTNLFVSGRNYDSSQESFFSELRFATDNTSGLNFLVGLNYLDEELDLSYNNPQGGNFYGALGGANLAEMFASGVTPPQFEAIGIPTGTPIDMIGLTPGATGLGGYLGDTFPLFFGNQQDLTSFAAFTEVTYELTSQWEVWGNARYTQDEKTIDFSQGYIPGACPVACAEIVAFLLDGADFEVSGTNDATFENTSLGGGINYRPTDTVLAYAKVVEGFKAGGFNPAALTLDLQAFDSEESTSYEVGLKTEWLDNRLWVNLAAFLQDREGTLVDVQDPLLEVIELGVNAGEIRNKGVELEVSASPIRGLRLDMAAGYLDAKFEEFDFGDDDFTGNTVPRTFKYTLSTILTYERPITEELDLFSYASYRNAWDGYTDNDNQEELSNPEVVDLRLGVTTNEGWRFIAYVDNAFDNRYTTLEIAGARVHRGTYSPGRTYGIKIAKEF